MVSGSGLCGVRYSIGIVSDVAVSWSFHFTQVPFVAADLGQSVHSDATAGGGGGHALV